MPVVLRTSALMVVALATILAAVPAHACSCITVVTSDTPRLSNGSPVPTIEELAQEDLVIFVGDVVDVRAKPSGDAAADKHFVEGSVTTFRVERAWGETLPEQVTVESGFPGGGCGFVFGDGKRYVVFATRQKNQVLTTSICTRTTLLEEVPDLLGHVIRLAGEGQEPQKRRSNDTAG